MSRTFLSRGWSGARTPTLIIILRTHTGHQHYRGPAAVSKIRPIHAFAYVLENVASNFDRRQHIREDFRKIQHYLGEAVIVDAARHGAKAHRLRAFWTNIMNVRVLNAANQLVIRDLQANVDSILDPNHRAQICTRADRLPFYPANEVGRPINALPTLVSYPGSYAFCNGGPGMVVNTNTNQLEEPNANERERAMGFRTLTTGAPNITEAQRRRLLGQAIDLRCLTFILSIGLAHQQAISTPHSDLNRLGGDLYQNYQKDQKNQTNQNADQIFGIASSTPIVAVDSNLTVEVAALATSIEPEAMQSSLTDSTDLTATGKMSAWKIGAQLTEEELKLLDDVLASHADCFAYSMFDLGRHTKYWMKIDLIDETPIFKPKHRLSTFEWDLV